MMKLTDLQIEALNTLKKEAVYTLSGDKRKFALSVGLNGAVVKSLVKKGLIEKYTGNKFFKQYYTLTEEGKKALYESEMLPEAIVEIALKDERLVNAATVFAALRGGNLHPKEIHEFFEAARALPGYEEKIMRYPCADFHDTLAFTIVERKKGKSKNNAA